MSSVGRYFFCASHESIYGLMKRGIWSDMPLNQELDAISPDTILVVKDDGTEANATDIKIQKYVRLISQPSGYLSRWEGNVASVFLVEVNPILLTRKDVLKIKRIKDGIIEHLKNIMVDLSSIFRVIVYSKTIEQKLRSAIQGESFKVSIVTDSRLFTESGVPPALVDDTFAIQTAIPQPAPPAAAPPPQDMIKIQKGDLLLSSMQTHVNTVNCVGIMGKGIALAFKNRYPDMFRDYAARCKRGEVKLGIPYCYRLIDNRLILNFPTKNHWKENSQLAEIEKGLQYLASHAKEWNIQSLAIPPLGCGNGNLNWVDVFPLMRKYLSQLQIPVEIYVPHESYSFGEPIRSQKTEPAEKRKGEKGDHKPQAKKKAV